MNMDEAANGEDFPDVEIEGIGSLKDFQSLSLAEIRKRLMPGRFGLYMATQPPPEGWPTDVVRQGSVLAVEDGSEHISSDWYKSFDGIKWNRFYSFSLSVYTQRYKQLPGYIYERVLLNNLIAYVPRVFITSALDGKRLCMASVESIPRPL